MSKTIIVILGIIAIIGLGSWFYLKSITQKSDINYITPVPYPGSSTRPITKSPSPTPKSSSTSIKPSTKPEIYIGPANRVE
jgi:hypothetical protein